MLKLGRVNLNDIYGSVKNAVINRNIAYNKSYTLLHRQLVQKDRLRLFEDVTLNILGKEYNVIDHYDIKSYSKEPYKPYTKDSPNKYNLGLNQLFVGQDPYKPYEGDPKKGIYHDECKIYPKNFRAVPFWSSDYSKVEDKDTMLITSLDSWGWAVEEWEFIIIKHKYFSRLMVQETLKKRRFLLKKNDFGFDLVSSIAELSDEIKQENFFIHEWQEPLGSNETGSYEPTTQEITCSYTQKRYKISYANGAEEIYTVKAKPMFLRKVGDNHNAIPSLSPLLYQNLTLRKLYPRVANIQEAIRKHGAIIYQATTEDTRREGSSIADWHKQQKEWLRKGWSELKADLKTLRTISPDKATREPTQSMIIMFSDRTCIKITKGGFRKVFHRETKEDSAWVETKMDDPTYTFVALVDKNTKELAISRVKFVEEWSKYFELYVYEKTSFWQKIVAPFTAFVTMLIAPYLTYLALPAGVALNTTITVLGVSTTAGALVGASAFFATIGVIGSFARVPFLQVVSVVGGLTTGIISSMWRTTTAKMLEKGVLEIGVNKLSSSMVTQTAQEASKKLTFGGILNYLKSNWLLALQSVLKIADTTASLLKKEIEPDEEVQEEEEEENKIILEDEDEIILPDFIRYVIDIPDEAIKTKTAPHL